MMKIMVAYDRSNVAKAALDLAKQHAKAFDAKVYVITSMLGGRDVPREKFANAERDLNHTETLLKAEKIACETHLLIRGMSPGEDLVQFAKENEIDVIIIGVKRRSKVGKFLLGSTAQYVIIKAPCPVVAVK